MKKSQSNWCCHHHFKNGICASFMFAHVLEVGTAKLKAIWTRSWSWRPPLRGVCCHFTHVLLDAETQLLQATGLVAIDAVLAGRLVSDSTLIESILMNRLKMPTHCDWVGWITSCHHMNPDWIGHTWQLQVIESGTHRFKLIELTKWFNHHALEIEVMTIFSTIFCRNICGICIIDTHNALQKSSGSFICDRTCVFCT